MAEGDPEVGGGPQIVGGTQAVGGSQAEGGEEDDEPWEVVQKRKHIREGKQLVSNVSDFRSNRNGSGHRTEIAGFYRMSMPSQHTTDRGQNIVVINPGSSNVRIGFANQQNPFNIPHCIARHVKGSNVNIRRTVQDQMLFSEATPTQQLARERGYDMIASLLKIPFLDEEIVDKSAPPKMGLVDGRTPYQSKAGTAFAWTNVMEKKIGTSLAVESSESLDQPQGDNKGIADEYAYRESIFGDEALKISSLEPYCLSRPMRRGHFNVSQHYTHQQVLEDLYAIWDWILIDKLHILPDDRNFYTAILVIPETFDTREIKEMLTIVLRDLKFSSAVVHQEGLAAAFGNGLTTACVVSIGAQVTSVICVEDGVAWPSTSITLPYGGEDISRCLLWIQRHYKTWPAIHTNPLQKPIDMLMLNKLKESYCHIKEGKFDGVAVVHSYEEGRPAESHKAKLSALNVPPMGLFYPTLFIPEEFPPPPRTWYHDYEDMLEDAWNMEFPRNDGMYLSGNNGSNTWDNYPVYTTKLKKDDKLGLADAITSCILSTGRIDLQRKLFCSIQLIGGVALTDGLIGAVEERVLHAIPSNEAINTVEVLQSRIDPSFISWKGGAILGILDFGREAWIHREDWIRNGIHIGSGRKYKDSYYVQAQAMCYINT